MGVRRVGRIGRAAACTAPLDRSPSDARHDHARIRTPRAMLADALERALPRLGPVVPDDDRLHVHPPHDGRHENPGLGVAASAPRASSARPHETARPARAAARAALRTCAARMRGPARRRARPGSRSATSSRSASIGCGLQTRSRSTCTRERVGELRRACEARAGAPRLDVAVADQAPARGQDLGDVDDDERLAALDGGVDGEHGRVLGERDVERREQDGRRRAETSETSSRGPLRRRVSIATRGGAPSAARHAPCGGTAVARREGRRTARRPSRAESRG